MEIDPSATSYKNEERLKCGMAADDHCPRCLQGPESIMHILRDCDEVRDNWYAVLHPDHYSRFFSFGLHSWIDWSPTISHIYSETNRCADHLAKQGLEAYVKWVLVDNVSPMLSLLLADDARSCSLPRLVMWFFLICSFSVVYQKKIITAHYYL